MLSFSFFLHVTLVRFQIFIMFRYQREDRPAARRPVDVSNLVDGDLRLTFGETFALAQDMAAGLIARHSIRRGDPVGIAARNSAASARQAAAANPPIPAPAMMILVFFTVPP